MKPLGGVGGIMLYCVESWVTKCSGKRTDNSLKSVGINVIGSGKFVGIIDNFLAIF
jgi:hypothetical protein